MPQSHFFDAHTHIQFSGFDADRDLPALREGKAQLDEIRNVVTEIEGEQLVVLNSTEATARRGASTNLVTVLVGSFATVGVLGLVYFLTRLDMSERRRVEAALRETEEFKTRVLESSGDNITVLSLDGRVLSMNAGGQRSMAIEDFEAVRAGFVEVKVRDDQFREMGFQRGEGVLGIGERKDLVALLAQHFRDHLHHGQFVIDQQNFGH